MKQSWMIYSRRKKYTVLTGHREMKRSRNKAVIFVTAVLKRKSGMILNTCRNLLLYFFLLQNPFCITSAPNESFHSKPGGDAQQHKDSIIKSTVDTMLIHKQEVFRGHVTAQQRCSYLFSSLSLQVAKMSLWFLLVYFFTFRSHCQVLGLTAQNHYIYQNVL